MDFNEVAACGVGMAVVGVEVGKYRKNEKKKERLSILQKISQQNGVILTIGNNSSNAMECSM